MRNDPTLEKRADKKDKPIPDEAGWIVDKNDASLKSTFKQMRYDLTNKRFLKSVFLPTKAYGVWKTREEYRSKSNCAGDFIVAATYDAFSLVLDFSLLYLGCKASEAVYNMIKGFF